MSKLGRVGWVAAVQGRLMDDLGDGGHERATERVRLFPAAASSRLVLELVSENKVKTEPPRWKTGML